jgi:hypothetical protein
MHQVPSMMDIMLGKNGGGHLVECDLDGQQFNSN